MDPIDAYFDAERAESVVFVAVGLIALALAAFGAFVVRTPAWRGAATTLALVALVQLVVGGAVYLRTPQDQARAHALLAGDRAQLRAVEVPRMQLVMGNFVVYRWVEIALVVLGAVAIAFGAAGSLVRGAGAGLAAQSALMLVLDWFAERRGDDYLRFLLAAAT